jgi:hypothetical protein
MAGEAYNDLAGRPSTKRLVEATTIKDWTSQVTSSNLSRLTPLTGVRHSAGRKCTENRRLNTRPSLRTFSESLNPPDPPLPGCFLEQLGSGVLPFALDRPDSVQSTSTCPPPETDEIGHDDAVNDASPSRPENEHSASDCSSPVAQTSQVPDSTDYVSASESEDILESPVPRGLSGLKRRPSEPLFLLSGSEVDRGPKNARLAELGEGTGDPPVHINTCLRRPSQLFLTPMLAPMVALIWLGRRAPLCRRCARASNTYRTVHFPTRPFPFTDLSLPVDHNRRSLANKTILIPFVDKPAPPQRSPSPGSIVVGDRRGLDRRGSPLDGSLRHPALQ